MTHYVIVSADEMGSEKKPSRLLLERGYKEEEKWINLMGKSIYHVII